MGKTKPLEVTQPAQGCKGYIDGIGFELWSHAVLPTPWECRMGTAQDDGGPVSQERNEKDRLSNLPDLFPWGNSSHANSAHPPLLQTHLISVHQDLLHSWGPSCPQLTTRPPQPESQAQVTLRGPAFSKRSKSRLPYQTQPLIKLL